MDPRTKKRLAALRSIFGAEWFRATNALPRLNAAGDNVGDKALRVWLLSETRRGNLTRELDFDAMQRRWVGTGRYTRELRYQLVNPRKKE
jgi:hypothetical protein